MIWRIVFSSALEARNRLFHGFFERYNFGIQTDQGRDLMMADLKALHEELFQSWRIAGAMTEITLGVLIKLSKKP
jgi:hypothetical protein